MNTNKQVLEEATLLAPVFNGSDDEIAMATQSWASIISSFSYMWGPGQTIGGTFQMSAENKRAIAVALQCYLNTKVDELNNVTTPPVVAPTVYNAPPVVAVPCPPEEEQQPAVDMEISYAESRSTIMNQPVKESVNPALKRMLELARIPHAQNYV
jgi:hypothetical protein